MAGRIIIPDGNRLAHKTVDSKLESRKDNIKDSYQWFLSNYKRFNYFRKFVFETSLSQDDIGLLKELGKPQMEFNILEPYISRQRGEFAKQEPSVYVHPADVMRNPVDPQMLQVLEDHFRAVIDDSNKDNMAYDTFTDLCAGGFSAWKVYTDYANPYSMEQDIKWRRTYDPTLTGFDKIARKSHKGDGRFCFEIYPKPRSEFESEYGKKYTSSMNFTRNVADFNWSYETGLGEEIILVCDYFEKRIVQKKIMQLVDGQVLTEEDYETFIDMWHKSGMMMQPPAIVGKPRMSDVVTVDQYIMVENDILEYNQTDYAHLPLIFVDGNSIWIRETEGNAAVQVTRPMVYHAEGIQKLKNFAGITLANELENMVQHKWKVQKEAIPAEYKDAYINVQKPSTLVWNGFKDNDPNIPLQAPQEIPRVPAPPELMTTFSMSDEMTQNILGSFDAAQGNPSGNVISGKAIIAGATQSNSAAMPYIIGYIKGLNRACEISLDLFPKYYKTPRSIPVKGIDGKRNFIMINAQGQPQMEYEPSSLEVRVEAGVNFEVQRQQALETLQTLMQASPILNKLISTTEPGVMMMLDNVDIRGIDALKQMVPEFIKDEQKQMEQQQQMAMQQQQMQMQQMQEFNPAQYEMAKVAQRAQEAQQKAQIETSRLKIDEYEAETNRMAQLIKAQSATLKSQQDAIKLIIEGAKIDAKKLSTSVDATQKQVEHAHNESMDLMNLHHQVNQSAITNQLGAKK